MSVPGPGEVPMAYPTHPPDGWSSLSPTHPRSSPLEASLVEATRGRLDYLERLATRYEALIEQLTARVAVLEKRTAPVEAITMTGGAFTERDTVTVYQREKNAAGACLVMDVATGMDCHRPVKSRGLCHVHAKSALRAINAGQTTWAAMEAAGKCLPKQSRSGAARKWLST